MINTERLELRFFHMNDVDSLTGLLSDPQVARWLPTLPLPFDRDAATSLVCQSHKDFKSKKGLSLAIALDSEKQVVGEVTLDFSNGEVGYWLGRTYWGRGIATEAVSAVIQHGKNNCDIDFFRAEVIRENSASKRLLERVGFEFSRLFHCDFTKKAWLEYDLIIF